MCQQFIVAPTELSRKLGPSQQLCASETQHGPQSMVEISGHKSTFCLVLISTCFVSCSGPDTSLYERVKGFNKNGKEKVMFNCLLVYQQLIQELSSDFHIRILKASGYLI